MRIAQEEIFGPTTALIPVGDFDEAIRVANGIRYGLSSSIFTRDVNKAFRAMRDLQAGITYINAGTTGAEVHLPFGGTKDTGQRPPRSGPGGARRLHGVEVDLRRLLRPARSARRSTTSSTPRPDPQARLVRARVGARDDPRRSLRGRRRPDRRLRALLLVRGGHRDVPGRRGGGTVGRDGGTGGAGARSFASRPSCRTTRSDAVVVALRAAHPYEEPAYDVYRTRVRATPLHRRRRARQPRPGRLRVRARGRGRHGARRARRGDRGRDEQRRRVPRAPRRPRGRAVELGSTSSRSSPTRS